MVPSINRSIHHFETNIYLGVQRMHCQQSKRKTIRVASGEFHNTSVNTGDCGKDLFWKRCLNIITEYHYQNFRTTLNFEVVDA